MGQIAKRVDDKRLLKLIRVFLNAGVMGNGLISPSVEGTPQGGPLTPRTQKITSNLSVPWVPPVMPHYHLTCVTYGCIQMSYAARQRNPEATTSEPGPNSAAPTIAAVGS